jgi:lipopolysaccharide/colanic/teichoic acid biosynthesis glycosyltransferase
LIFLLIYDILFNVIGKEIIFNKKIAMRLYPAFKRTFDIASSLFAIMLLLPIIAAISFVISMESPGGPFFIQDRVGKGGKNFRIVKFRTMRRDADHTGSIIAGNGDYRVTRIGKLLRDTKLDEFPNLINVLLGQMSIVGPRPELPQFLPYYQDGFREIFAVRPGLTGPAQLVYFYEYSLLPKDNVEEYYQNTIMRHKLDIDLEYARNCNMQWDFSLVFSTLSRLLIREKGGDRREGKSVLQG